MRTDEDEARYTRTMLELGAMGSAGLPSHNPDATCPKCGADANRVMTAYHAHSLMPTSMFGWMPYAACPAGRRVDCLGEHLCRTCGRCDHSWAERTVDSQ